MKQSVISIMLVIQILLYPLSVGAHEDYISLDTPAPSQAIDYPLPYPGILPDNPLYSMKAIRDMLSGFLISDPLKKADFNIAAADSRISAALALIDQKKNTDLTASVISKAENYFEKALNNTREAASQGLDTSGTIKKLTQSNRKHLEVISQIENRIDNNRNKIIALKKRVTLLGQEIERLP